MEQTSANVPRGSAWFSANEANHLHEMHFPKRRADWLLGRWTAKNAVALFLDIPAEPQALSEIEIRPASSGAPEVFIRNETAPLSISLSHRAGVGACALAPSGVLLGCDLELVEPHGVAFATDYFTAEEQALVMGAPLTERFGLLSLLWSGKESALKLLGEGMRLDTRRVAVSFPVAPKLQNENQEHSAQTPFISARTSSHYCSWSRLQVRDSDGHTFHGWWNQTSDLLRTILAVPPPDSPILLAHKCSLSC